MNRVSRDLKPVALQAVLIMLCFGLFLHPDTPEPVLPRLNLLPAPSHGIALSHRFMISGSFRVQCRGYRSWRINTAIRRLKSRLSDRTGMVFSINGFRDSDSSPNGPSVTFRTFSFWSICTDFLR